MLNGETRRHLEKPEWREKMKGTILSHVLH